MNQENSQLELSGIQLRESKTQPRVSMSREIGEAVITHTIFGKAKVRIIRKHDQMRRTLWLAGMAGATAIGVVVWQGWFASQQTEPVAGADSLFSASSGVQGSALAASTENLAQSSASSSASSVPGASAPIAVQSVPQQAIEIKTIGKPPARPLIGRQIPVAGPSATSAVQQVPPAGQPGAVAVRRKPVTPQPVPTGNPATPATSNALKNQTGAQLPPKLLPQKQPGVPAVAAARATQSAASSPAAVVPPVTPLVKEDAATQLPAGDKPLSDPISTPGK